MLDQPTIRCLCRLAVLLLTMVCGGAGIAAETPAVGEYQVKAAFIYNFTKFVEWPEDAAATNDVPFIIGIVGNDPFGGALDEVVKSQQVAGRPLVVRRFKRGDSVTGCRILFISRSETDRLESLLKQIDSQSVLTVADLDGGASRGVMINLVVDQGSVKMEVNLARAGRARLHISSKLLGLAKIVESDR